MTTFASVPVAILRDHQLPAAIQLIGLLMHLRPRTTPTSPSELQAQSGLSRPTVLRGIAQFADWVTAVPPGPHRQVSDQRVSLPATC